MYTLPFSKKQISFQTSVYPHDNPVRFLMSEWAFEIWCPDPNPTIEPLHHVGSNYLVNPGENGGPFDQKGSHRSTK